MKTTLLTTIAFSAICTASHAATLQMVTATGTPTSDGWAVSLDNGDLSFNGEFNGDSATNGGGSAAGAGAAAWALYANRENDASATYTLAGGALTVGQIASLDFDNGWVNTDFVVGIKFLNSGVDALELRFTGGEANYVIADGALTDTAIGFTSDGFNVAMTLTASGSYSLNVGGSDFTGTLNNGQTSINQIQVFNASAGEGGERNLFFNNLSVTQVPEPSSVALLGLGGMALILRRRK